MNQFKTIKQAKDYLASRIAEEAVREGVPLTEIERKMLYFSETDWTLPDMKQVSAEFDEAYDQNEYEQKIGKLVRQINVRDHSQSQIDTETWDEAVVKLSEGDNYLSVLANIVEAPEPGLNGFLPTLDNPPFRPPHDRLKLWVAALLVVFALPAIIAMLSWIFRVRFWVLMDWFFEDRNRFGLLVIAGLLIWFLWKIRSDLKIILEGLTRRK